jgi:hypothetical protein
MEREACLRAGGSRGWMSKLAAASPDLPSVGVLMYRLSPRCGVLFRKLSKLLNQEGALSAPCSPQAPSRAPGMLRTGLIRHFRCHITVCYTQLITPTSVDELPVAGGTCTGGAHRCKAKQGRREDRADV